MPLALNTAETVLRQPPGLTFLTAFDGCVAPSPTGSFPFPFEYYMEIFLSTTDTSKIASQCQNVTARGTTTNSAEQQLNPAILAGAGPQYSSPAAVS